MFVFAHSLLRDNQGKNIWEEKKDIGFKCLKVEEKIIPGCIKNETMSDVEDKF